MAESYDWNDWDRQIIEEFRANGGNVGGQFAGTPLLLLTTTGAKSGEPRTRPLAYPSEGDRIYVFAVNRGALTNPAWYHNLVAHPDVIVELGSEKFEARATVVDSKEGDRLGSIQVQKISALASLAAKITRKVPYLRSNICNLSRYMAELENLLEHSCAFASNATLTTQTDKVASTTVVIMWKERDDGGSDSDERWPDGCGGTRTTGDGRDERGEVSPAEKRRVGGFPGG